MRQKERKWEYSGTCELSGALWKTEEWYILETNKTVHGEMWPWIISNTDLLTHLPLIRLLGLLQICLPSPLILLPSLPIFYQCFSPATNDNWMPTRRKKAIYLTLCGNVMYSFGECICFQTESVERNGGEIKWKEVNSSLGLQSRCIGVGEVSG